MRRRLDVFGTDAIPDTALSVDGGIVFLPQSMEIVEKMLDEHGFSSSPTIAVQSDLNTVQMVIYFGVPIPPGAVVEPFGDVNAKWTQALPGAVRVVDRMLIAPAPGTRTIVLTRDPAIVAKLAKTGSTHFLTEEEKTGPTAPIVASAQNLASKPVIAGLGGKLSPGAMILGAFFGAVALYSIFSQKRVRSR